MSYNVPNDWGNYYNNCDYCGNSYHASEGGCSCDDNVNCCQRPWLTKSGYTLNYDTWTRRDYVATRTARRDHRDGTIKAGQRYDEYRYTEIDDRTGDVWRDVEKRPVHPNGHWLRKIESAFVTTTR